MSPHWFRNPLLILPLCLMLILMLAVACGTSEEAPAAPAAATTAPPAAAPAATTAPAAAAPAAAVPAPTAVPAAVSKPDDGAMAGPKYAPSFSDYWKPPTEFYGQPVYGGTVRINYEDPLEHANTWGAASGVTDRYRNPTHSNLIMDNPYDSAAAIIPDLAEGWTIHDDNAGVTFALRETQWHNGDEFVCADAKFSFETMATGEGITASYMEGKLGHLDLSALECTDDRTLEMRFTSPTGTPLLALSNRRAKIFNKAWFEAGGEDVMFQDVSVGTGPYIWAEGQTVGYDEQHFEKNPNYFIPELPYVDELVIFGILDESAQQAAMLAHQTDWHWVRNFGQYDAYVEHDQIQTVIRATRGNFAFWQNPRVAPFDNVKVRQAIVMGIDRNAGIAVLQDGNASAGFLYAPGSAWELDQATGCAVPGWCISEDMDSVRAEAKAILEGEGFDFEKSYLFTVESDQQVVGRATFLQEQLRLLGIKTEFDLVETIAYRQQEAQGTWGAFLPRNNTQVEDDPNAGLGPYIRCNSTGNFWTPNGPCLDGLQGLLDQALIEIDKTKRKALSDEIQLAMMKEYVKFPVYWEQEAVSFWPEVRGYSHMPAPFGAFTKYMHLWIDPSHKDDKGFKGQTTGVPGGTQ